MSRSARETEALAARWVRTLKAGSVVALVGELGSGKTTFVRGMARGLGSRHRVQSPTFVLLHTYPGKKPLHHLDFYRLESLAELEELGIEELFAGSGIAVVEWADKFPKNFPRHTTWVSLKYSGPERRAIHITG
ncbi:MAG: tRNA (adenosine(37)-N6)-threonylcarbamoyltransferase complex ATPase subunit type 1 TsaE [Candidatus Omnitrophica bacterium]|nr:tRNA (adenosine(37)-N6)-threonylcarbamoyltransferase complex ATPase subunit type 1 TsaE [Candidatus Omnitrophota bacterium]